MIKYESNNPDYLFFDVFGCDHIKRKYINSIKIAYYTENKLPDFNEADYALGMSHINYLDRYFRYPSHFMNSLQTFNNTHIKLIRNNSSLIYRQKKFCAAVISNNLGKFRNRFIEELSKYKPVDMGGNYKNTVGKRINDKIQFFSSYKFSIAMENSDGDGYVSEKIIDSFNSGTIPIYYGDYIVDEYINSHSFILVRNEIDINYKIEMIKEIDNNDELYLLYIKQDVLLDEDIYKKKEKDYNNFFGHIFEQDKEKARRIDHNYYKNKCTN